VLNKIFKIEMSLKSETNESDEISIEEKIKKYEYFVNEVLKNDLKKVLKRKELICQQMANYLQIKDFIKRIQENSSNESEDKSVKVESDIGSNFYVECVLYAFNYNLY
jgi:hypothetical protein